MNSLRRIALLLMLALVACQSDQTRQSDGQISSSPATNYTGKKLFELKSSKSTGLSFSNTIIEDFYHNILTNSYMYNGGGVAIFDYDNDGMDDVYLVSSMESNKLFRNKGNWKFEDVTEQAGVQASTGFKTGVSVVDINSDGFLDLYVCRTGLKVVEERKNLLFVNNKNGTFSELGSTYGLDDASPSNHANFFDYDGDGDLDMYLLNHPVDFTIVNKARVEKNPDGTYKRLTAPLDEFESDKLYRNNGKGKFTDVSKEAGINNRAFGLSVSVSDINKDGRPDIFIANDYIEPDLLYINNGNGTFTNKAWEYLRHMSNHTMGTDLADFNNDGLIDIVSLDMLAEDNYRQKALMTTMMKDRVNTLKKFGYGAQQMRNVLQLNNGNGSFSEIGCMSGISNTDWSWSVQLVDFDNDSHKDMFVTNGYRRDVSNLDYLNFTSDSIRRTGGLSSKRFKTIYEYLELIPEGKLRNYVFKNTGNLCFEDYTDNWGISDLSFSNGSAYGDLDGDGDMDMVINNIEDDAFVYENKNSSNNYLKIKLSGSKNNIEGVGAGVEIYLGDKKIYQEKNVIRGFFSSVSSILHFGLGDVESVDRIKVYWPDGKVQELKNVPANQELLVEYSGAKNSNKDNAVAPILTSCEIDGLKFSHRENDFDDIDRERLLPRKFSTQGAKLAKGDVNGDGQMDLYLCGALGMSGQLFVGKNGRFVKSSENIWADDKNYEDSDALFFDADHDGDLDLYVVSGGTSLKGNGNLYQDRIYFNDGSGGFTKGELPSINSTGSSVINIDYDQDGDDDLIIGGRINPGSYPLPGKTIVLQNTKGIFQDVSSTIGKDIVDLGMVSSVNKGDLNNDGKDELIIAGEWMDINVFSFDNNSFTSVTKEFGLENTKGWWNNIVLDDLDNDGDLDIVAGNLGLNTRYKSNNKAAIKVHAKDFDGNSAIDAVLSWVYKGKRYPVPIYDQLVKQLPLVKKKFRRYSDYANASLTEVLGSAELKDALTLETNTFSTTYFRNDKGSFKAIQLPMAAQMSITYGIEIFDINKDGQKDIILVGNDLGFDAETGPLDASDGIVLLNKNNQFEFLPNYLSGIWASGEARDISSITLNEKEYLLVTNSNGPLQIFCNK